MPVVNGPLTFAPMLTLHDIGKDLPTHLPLINVKAFVEPSEVGILPKMILWYNVYAKNQDRKKKKKLSSLGWDEGYMCLGGKTFKK